MMHRDTNWRLTTVGEEVAESMIEHDTALPLVVTEMQYNSAPMGALPDVTSYWRYSEMFFTVGTHPEVIRAIARARIYGHRLRVTYGDWETGLAKHYGFPGYGYVGVTTGPIRWPLLVYNSRSHGGHTIFTKDVVQIAHSNKRKGGVIWQHPTYQEDW